MLKAVLDKIDDLSADVKKEYVMKDGHYILQLEGDMGILGFVTKAVHDEQLTKLSEFRDNNRALNTKTTDLEAKLKTFEGVDPAEFKTLKEKLKNVGASDGDVQKAIHTAVTAAVEPLTKKLADMEVADKKKTVDLATETFRNTLKDAGIKAGVDEKMMPIFVDHALKTFQYVDGKFTPKAGDAPVYSKAKPAEVITPEEWAANLIPEMPGFFKQSGGGGGGNGGGGGRNSAGKKIISGTDALEFGKNLEEIAKGNVVIQ